MACTGACSSRQGSGGEQRGEKHYELKRRGSVFGMPAPRVWPPPYSPHLSAMGSPEDSWEVRAFAEDMATCSEQWPPRSYSCSFCGREFRTAQALGGHMNVHRRERAYANQIGLLKSNSNSSDNLTSPPQSGLGPSSQPPAPLGLCLLYPNAQNTPSDSAFTHPYKYHPNPPLSSPQCSRSKNSSDSSLSESGFLPESLYPVDSSNKPPYRHPAWDALELHDDTLDLELRLGHAP